MMLFTVRDVTASTSTGQACTLGFHKADFVKRPIPKSQKQGHAVIYF
jgi:hypothetical protein